MVTKRSGNYCKGRTKAGKPCRAAATDGGLCFFHANPNKASELGRIGGRSKAHAAAETGDPPPTLDNAIAVRDAVARLGADVLSGKLRARIPAGLAPLMNLLLHAIKTADLEQRLAKLEQQSKLTDGTSDEPAAAGDQDRGPRAAGGEVGSAVSDFTDDEVTKIIREAEETSVGEKAIKADGLSHRLDISKT